MASMTLSVVCARVAAQRSVHSSSRLELSSVEQWVEGDNLADEKGYGEARKSMEQQTYGAERRP